MSQVQVQSDAAKEAKKRRRARPRDPVARTVRYGPFGREIVNAAGYASPGALTSGGKTPAKRKQSSDARTRTNIEQVRAESQEFDQDNCLYQAMMTRVCDVVLGDGSTLQAKTANARQNSKREELWKAYWQLPEVRQLDDGPAIERKILRHFNVDGDHLVVRDGETKLIQLVVADQIDAGGKIRSENGRVIEQGVEIDELRRPIRFHVVPFDAWGNPVPSRGKWQKAEGCTYIANRRRIDQTRGEPVMQSAFAMLHRINDVCDSEAAAWQLLSRMAVSITRENGAQVSYDTSEADDEMSSDEAARRIAERVHDFGHSLVFHGEPGDEVKGIERNIPGQNFVESLKMFMRLLGMPLGFSLEFTLLIWSDTNYSSGRASIKQVERNCRPYRAAVARVLSDIYRWKVQQWIADGLINDSADKFAHEWHFPPYPFIDPQKEAEAQTEALKSGMTSATREAKANGVEFSDLIAERAEDLKAVAEKVKAHNEAFPESPVTIADFLPRADSAAASKPPVEATKPAQTQTTTVTEAVSA